jgi:raffinose/stachyose/melibiose transport system permease protein
MVKVHAEAAGVGDESRAGARLKSAVRGRRARGGPRQAPWLLVVPALALTLVVHFAAPAAGGWYAFTNWDGIGPAKWVGLDNFKDILRNPDTRTALFNTLKLAGSFFVLVNVIGLSLALALNKVLKTRFVLRTLFFIPLVLSPLAVGFIWSYVFDYQGALNRILGAVGLESWKHGWLGDPRWALWTILVVLVWQYTGLAMVIYLAGLQGIPEELDEAATVDGATAFTRFRRITLPLLAPAITVVATLTLIIGLRVFDQVLALTDGGPVGASETLATQVYKQTFLYGRFGYGAAFAMILTLLILVLSMGQLAILRAREKRI